MADREQFDLGRQGFESWPWMYGYQWFTVFEKVRAEGVEAAKPEILLLANWCSIYAKPEEAASIEEWAQGDWRDLHRILNTCMMIAQRERTWKFEKQEVIAFEDTPALPPAQPDREMDTMAPEPSTGRGDRVPRTERVREINVDAPPNPQTHASSRPGQLPVRPESLLFSQAVRNRRATPARDTQERGPRRQEA